MISVSDHILRWLLDATVTAGVLLGVVSVILFFVRRPAWRRGIATAALAASAVIGVLHVLPGTAVWSLRWYDIQEPRVLPWLDDRVGASGTAAIDSARASVGVAHATMAQRAWYWGRETGPAILVWGYAAIAGVMVLRLISGAVWLWRMVRRAECAPAGVMATVRDLGGGRTRVKISVYLDRPVVVGLRRPTILLPTALLSDVNETELRAILAHELAHCRAGDLARGWLAAICWILFFPLPPLWLVLRTLRLSQEQLADQAAALHKGALEYAELLARLARQRSVRLSGVAMGAWRSPSETMQRVQALIQWRPTAQTRRARWAIMAAGFIILAAGTGLGMVTLNDTTPAARVRVAELHGVRYLLSQQEANGGWMSASGPAATALVTRALLQAGVPVDHPAIARARAFLDARQQPDGGFYTDALPTYETAVVLSVYAAFEDRDAQQRLKRGRLFLAQAERVQTKAGAWYEIAAPGGVMSIMGDSADAQPPQGDASDILNTYGKMSYANWKSMAYAQLSAADPRVTAARRWLTQHWTVDHHPGTGSADGHYYFLMAASRTLGAADASHTADGSFGWRNDVQNWLLAAQGQDGSWLNQRSGAWMEDRPQLVTAYALLALQAAR